MFHTKVVEKNNIHILFSITFFRKSCLYNVENIAGQGKPQMTIWRMCNAWWIAKSTNTHTHNMCHLLLFHRNNGCTNAPQCYVIRTSPVCHLTSSASNNLLPRCKHYVSFPYRVDKANGEMMRGTWTPLQTPNTMRHCSSTLLTYRNHLKMHKNCARCTPIVKNKNLILPPNLFYIKPVLPPTVLLSGPFWL
jgi:hypothetical protein